MKNREKGTGAPTRRCPSEPFGFRSEPVSCVASRRTSSTRCSFPESTSTSLDLTRLGNSLIQHSGQAPESPRHRIGFCRESSVKTRGKGEKYLERYRSSYTTVPFGNLRFPIGTGFVRGFKKSRAQCSVLDRPSASLGLTRLGHSLIQHSGQAPESPKHRIRSRRERPI